MAGYKDRLKGNPLALQNMVDNAIGDVLPENALIPLPDGVYTYKRFTMTPTGLIVPDDVTSDELIDVGEVIYDLQSSLQWIVGDLMNSMKRIWGDSYQRVAAQLGYEVKTVQEWASICRKVSIRMEALSFSHHQLVAPYTPEEQVGMLRWAAENKASVGALRKEIAKMKQGNIGGGSKFQFSAAVMEGEHHSYVHLTRIRNAINGHQTLTAKQILEDARKLKEFAEGVIKDLTGE